MDRLIYPAVLRLPHVESHASHIHCTICPIKRDTRPNRCAQTYGWIVKVGFTCLEDEDRHFRIFGKTTGYNEPGSLERRLINKAHHRSHAMLLAPPPAHKILHIS